MHPHVCSSNTARNTHAMCHAINTTTSYLRCPGNISMNSTEVQNHRRTSYTQAIDIHRYYTTHSLIIDKIDSVMESIYGLMHGHLS